MDVLDVEENAEVYDDDWESDPTQGAEDPEDKPSVCESIKETLQILDLFMSNKFEEALDIAEPWAHCSPYHALGKSTICFIQSLLSFDQEDFAHTVEVLKESVNVCNRLRKKGTLLYISRLIKGVDYTLYTIEEAHAELCYAECLLIKVLITFVADNSFVNFIKGGFRIRACYRAYKEALQILENRIWHDEEERRHYESGVRMGLGIFYLVVAHLPTRVIRMLEMIGFCGDKELGLQQMYASVSLDGSLRAPLTALFLLCYNIIITYLFGLADGDLVSSEYIVKTMLKRYPRGALYLFLHGRLQEVKGEIDQAINTLQDSLTVQDKWRQMRNLGSWEIMWCYSFKFEWRLAEKYLDFLRKESRWSPAIYTYAYALCLYMRYCEDGEKDLKMMEEIMDHMKKVPSLKQKLAGKSFPLEKFVVAKSKKFVAQNNRLLLPFTVPSLKQKLAGKSFPLEKFVVAKSKEFVAQNNRLLLAFTEMMYVFNTFPNFREKREIMERILGDIEQRAPKKPQIEGECEAQAIEDYCLATLLKGASLKILRHFEEAKEAFHEVLRLENHLKDDLYLATYAMAEIGYMAMECGDRPEALKWLHQSINTHTDYHLESFLHYRIHAAIRHIHSFEDAHKVDELSVHISDVTLHNVTLHDVSLHTSVDNDAFYEAEDNADVLHQRKNYEATW